MDYAIIGIHGLSNKPQPEKLAKWWREAMLEGLKKNKGLSVDSLPFSSVYWANRMYDGPENQPKGHPDRYREAKAGDLKRYDDGWVDAIREKARDVGGDMLDTLKGMFGIDKTAGLVLKKKLPDLWRYYQEQDIRDELRRRLKNEVLNHPGKKIMLIAHSMGSIIAYDELRSLGKENPQLAIEHFVTIGSPLGLPHVKMKIMEESAPVRTPTIVKRWSNLADRRDPVAVDLHLADDYGPNAANVRVKDDLVLNDWGGICHKSYGYLRTPEFSDLLAEFIEA